MMSLLLGNSGWLALIGALVIGAFGLLAKGRLDGAKKERAKQAKAEQKAVDIADEIDDAIAGRDPQANREELKKWGKR